MLEVHKDNFEAEVLGASGLVVVDFWSPNCEKCLALMPDMEALEGKYKDKVKFAKLNIQGNRRLALSLGVRGLPAMGFFKGGQKVALLTPEEVSPEAVEGKIRELL
ncbi:thioredoxin domain-containing protein [Moorellaceae bacterium AZ2]